MTATCPRIWHACNTGTERESSHYFGHVAHAAVRREGEVGDPEHIQVVPEQGSFPRPSSPLASYFLLDASDLEISLYIVL